MGYSIDCGKVNPDSGCGHVIRADTEDELMRKAAEHAQEDHDMEPTPELMAEVRKHVERT